MKSGNIFSDPAIIDNIKKIENSPETKKKLAYIKAELKENIANPLYIGFVAIVAAAVVYYFLGRYAIFILFFIWSFYFKYSEKKKKSVSDSYVNNFLKPVLEEILPDTKLDYFGQMDLDTLINLVYDSKTYYSDVHITFGDEYKTEFCNFHAYHEKYNKKGGRSTHTDFRGQALKVSFETGITGHIRVVPIHSNALSAEPVCTPYGNRRKDEKRIETESIEFNNSYAIFSTDDFYTRLILDANIIEFLNNTKNNTKITIYMNEKYISIAFETNTALFSQPSFPSSVDNLSLSGEYEKVRNKLAFFYELIALIMKNF